MAIEKKRTAEGTRKNRKIRKNGSRKWKKKLLLLSIRCKPKFDELYFLTSSFHYTNTRLIFNTRETKIFFL